MGIWADVANVGWVGAEDDDMELWISINVEREQAAERGEGEPPPMPYAAWQLDCWLAHHLRMSRLERENLAASSLQVGIASGRLPDWPAWSELMAEVPL